ncbi:phytanoyl-CoA dioxygenase family protein [Solimicrobium silvestre]|uniref:Phytanoyl-CoA dioxygenase (PhyH) n=1 Tax=Solimicrobium silvestre TaxID=2099400 RepID=A0A2S9GZN5_9BURK|nr:phytanoyl-CoA dioxygenase family protein [Solimicrobium silvestre]PRC93199.1 Phytanoyl-CoA dioxygenase (PhyH) [Solimicrobium silvestre]
MLTPHQLANFQQNGFLVLPQLADSAYCAEVLAFAQKQLADAVQPLELEADTGYLGAPESKAHAGGETVRRLLQVTLRGSLISDWATGPSLSEPLKQLLGNEIRLSQVHHNCIMTKQPRFSSVTGWHRDSRYWQFQRAELISAWLALRNETVENGCLLVIPSSHRVQVEAEGLDTAQFLRADYPANQALLAQAVAVPLNVGDVLLFSSNLFHAAGHNQTELTKFSMVFTYRALDNPPLAGSRSASLPEIAI